MNISQMRLNSLFPTDPKKKKSSGYGILDEFINNIMPMIQGQGDVNRLRQEGDLKAEQQRTDNAVRTQFNLGRVAPALPQIAQSIMQPQQPEMRTVMQGMNPYQEATLGLREKELLSREALAKDKQTETERKNLATEADKKARLGILLEKESKNDLTESEAIELKAFKDMARIQQGQRFTTTRDETQQGYAKDRIDKTAEHAGVRQEDQQKATKELTERRAELEREAIILRSDNSKEAVERKAQIDRELAINKPMVPSQEKTNVQLKYNKLINEKPEYRDFVSINPDTGLVEVLPVGETKAWARDTVGPTEVQRQEILKYLGMSDEKKEVKKDSLGIR